MNLMEYYFPHSPEKNHLLEQRMLQGRKGHVSVVMADGHVLTAGGWDRDQSVCLSLIELFDPESG